MQLVLIRRIDKLTLMNYSRIVPAVLAAALSALLIAPACQSLPVESPSADRLIALGPPDAQCTPVDTHTELYVLFGTVPLRTASPEKLFAGNASSYRLRREIRWHDVLVSVPGGLILSLTKNTLVVEECAAEPAFLTATEKRSYLEKAAAKETEEQQKKVNAALDAFLKQLADSDEADVVVLLKSGERRAGRLAEVRETEIVLEITAEAAPDDDKVENVEDRRDTIRLEEIRRLILLEEK